MSLLAGSRGREELLIICGTMMESVEGSAAVLSPELGPCTGCVQLLRRESVSTKTQASVFCFLKIQIKEAPACATVELRACSFPAEGYNFMLATFDPLAQEKFFINEYKF